MYVRLSRDPFSLYISHVTKPCAKPKLIQVTLLCYDVCLGDEKSEGLTFCTGFTYVNERLKKFACSWC